MVGVTNKEMNQTEFLTEILQGNISAIQFISCLGAISQCWDDLIDKDKPVSDSQIHEMMWQCLVYLPQNAFYRQYFNELHPLVQSVMNDYLDSNILEYGDNTDRGVAYTLRDNMCCIISKCAYLIGGYSHMRAVSPAIRKFVHNENIIEYIEGSK